MSHTWSSATGQTDRPSPPRYASNLFTALEYQFSIECEEEAVGRYIDDIFSGLTGSEDRGEAAAVYRIERLPDSGAQTHRLTLDGRHLATTITLARAMQFLLWHINRTTVAMSQTTLLIHAAGVAHTGQAIVMPAGEEAGKTTLAAGLLQQGFDYLSDEIVAIDPETLQARSYAKPLSIDPGSWPVLPALKPSLPADLSSLQADQWQVPLRAIHERGPVTSAPIRYIIAPRYVAGARTSLVPLPRSSALRELAENAFNFRGFPGGLDVLASVVRRSDCFRLTVGSLEEACTLVREVVSTSRLNERSQQ